MTIRLRLTLLFAALLGGLSAVWMVALIAGLALTLDRIVEADVRNKVHVVVDYLHDLDAELGLNAFNPLHLLDPGALIGGLAGSLTAPVLNRAAIEAQYVSADALQVQAVIRYEQAMLQAVTDVTTQLANLSNIQASYATRAQQVGRLVKSVEMSTVLFKAARADYVEVLLVRRDLLEAEFELIERRMELQQAVVGLYQALGGGWRPS